MGLVTHCGSLFEKKKNNNGNNNLLFENKGKFKIFKIFWGYKVIFTHSNLTQSLTNGG
jgi:hypothetical protein